MYPGVTEESTFQAGSTKHCYSNWLQLTSDKFILQTITGARLEFDDVPVQTHRPGQLNFSQVEHDVIDLQIQEFINLGIVEKASSSDWEFVSNVFSRLKKNGSSRLILNLVKLNPFVRYLHFKMDTIEAVLNLMRPNCYMASIDLVNAYFSVPIAEDDRRFLRFVWLNELYQFTVMPNGLSSAPRIFTKILKPVYAHLRQQGHIACGYIDDSFITANSYINCANSIACTHDLFKSLGFYINYEKSVMVPSQEIEHLGFVLNSIQMTVTLTTRKREALIAKCIQIRNAYAPTIRAVAELIGVLVASFTGVEFGHLHYRLLDHEKVEALQRVCGDYDKTFFLSDAAKLQIQWWIDFVATERRNIEHGKITYILTTDASEDGWGAVFADLTDDKQCTGGRWSPDEGNNHINVLELKAVFLGLKSFCANLSAVHIKILVDNTTAVAYINHMGGSHSPSCNEQALDIWNFCREHSLWLTAAHLPGCLNVLADEKSRVFNDKTEWKLNTTVFNDIINEFGVPDIDLFASRMNYQFKPFVAWLPDPEAKFIDAFTLDWANAMFYAFPPFSIVSQVLRKVEFDGATGILVVPNWPTQAWFPLLRQLLLAAPMTLKWKPDLVALPFRQGQHPLGRKLQLMACFISGKR